ncbi:RNA polymerase sigma-70 factor, ECF subfamily [Arachidicoccus rhizosphaerae]|jgi:RNA polymerase sigma-70 factor (ECF subfamily)|uniref:RNA polymerase sigma-70 factor, ECF subfamily n=1 Tax=Arachidicoccus rhizosphaerae TaxID=551991 RepID=A0A1H4BGE7_9BACT|nr:RNA polymerase sigma-70 factor [Arachidicoccus rhizosphaerae]SEA47134.1 RNA polymerase sigma-70 factor, ECF subfamily [Arachidicoccus rhizosphaerae]
MRILQAYDDHTLMEQIKNDDQAAFEVLFDRYNGLLISHVYQRIRDISEAEDVVQDIFIKLWERRNEIACTNIAGYLFTAARNKVLNLIKHRQVIVQYENDFKRFAAAHPMNSTEHQLEKKELEAILDAEIKKLSPRMRQVFLMSRKEQLSHQQIADQLGITKFTVNDHIKASLRILKAKIGVIILLILWTGHLNP